MSMIEDDFEDEHEVSENPELEAEFTKYVEETHALIFDKVNQAEKLLDEACKIADEKGVGFYSDISPLSQAYYVSPKGKFSELDSSVVSEITAAYSEWDSSGWQHSAVC